MPKRILNGTLIAVVGLCLSTLLLAQQPTPAPPERVVAIKEAFEESQARLRNYQWIETTSVTLKGEVKSQKKNRCFYGPDGQVQKVPIGTPQQPSTPGGLRGRVAKNKKEDLTDYIDQAVGIIKSYLPPDPERLQKSKDANKATIDLTEQKRANVKFSDYMQAGDVMSIEIDLPTNLIFYLNISTFLQQDPVGLEVRFLRMPDRTMYTSTVTLNAPEKQLLVVVQNSEFTPVK